MIQAWHWVPGFRMRPRTSGEPSCLFSVLLVVAPFLPPFWVEEQRICARSWIDLPNETVLMNSYAPRLSPAPSSRLTFVADRP